MSGVCISCPNYVVWWCRHEHGAYCEKYPHLPHWKAWDKCTLQNVNKGDLR